MIQNSKFHRKIRLSICLMNSFRPLQPFISLFTPNAIFKMCFKMFQVCIIIHLTMFQIPFLILLKSHVIKYIKQTDFITQINRQMNVRLVSNRPRLYQHFDDLLEQSIFQRLNSMSRGHLNSVLTQKNIVALFLLSFFKKSLEMFRQTTLFSLKSAQMHKY